MRVLVVEDDENKRRSLEGFLKDVSGVSAVEGAASHNSALRRLVSDQFDVVLLDMTIPTFDAVAGEERGRSHPLGGMELLRQISRRHLDPWVIVVTQFDRFGEGAEARSLEELDAELVRLSPDLYLGAVFYSPLGLEWQENLRKLLLEAQSRGERE